ncbi:hypothetical protein N0V90_002269 [Kalmusia sp. IMI 367209]|nr:hypothetical protein N0V90_002269 [Kalmusia sp. IMI 367209]
MSSTISFELENRGLQIGIVNGSVSTTFHSGPVLTPSFFKTSNYESHKNVNPERLPRTCDWFLKHPTFQKWKYSSTNNLLWLSANPGCGKSVLSRALVDEKLVATESATLCYFFFKNNEEQDNIAAALCALLHQLLCTHDSLLQTYIAPAFGKWGSNLRSDVEKLWKIFLSAATDSSVGDVICILDALDECQHPDRNILIKFLERFYTCASRSSTSGSILKFIVTSRPYSDIERYFRTLTKEVPTIRLAGEEESDKISTEIEIYIKAKVKEILSNRDVGWEVQYALQKRLSETPNRTYLWLHLTLDEVESTLGNTKKKLLKAVDTLPKTVEEAYSSILARSEQKETMKVLQIIVAARRPLTLSEIDVALEIDPESESYAVLDLEGKEGRRKWIQQACGLFVSVIDSRVFLIHQTAREFLVRKDSQRLLAQEWRHSIDLQTAHQVLSKICITHLLFEEFQDFCNLIRGNGTYTSPSQVAKEYAEKFALLDYSARHWIYHVQEANLDSCRWISRILKLCDIKNRSSCVWVNIYDRWTPLPSGSYDQSNQSILYWAAVFGLVHEAEYLLRKSDLVSHEQSDYFTTALQAAARNENRGKELVVLFLRLGDRVEITEKVVEAAGRNRIQGIEIMELLLKLGSDRFVITEALVAEIARNFDQETMSLFLNTQGDKIKITEEVFKAAVHNRRTKGREIIALFLERRPDEVKITENVFKEVLRNNKRGKEIIPFHLRQQGNEVKIIKKMIEVVRNEK